MTTEERFEKIEGGIRDLIVVSRTVLDSMQEFRGSMQEMREARKHTDDKLNALTQAQIESEKKVSRLADIVDKLIRFGGPNGQTGSR